MNFTPINLEEKFTKFDDRWAPKVIAEMNENQFKLVKIQGEFIWHKHEETDEVFMVLDGELEIMLREGEVNLSSGEMFVVPKNLEHKLVANQICKIMIIEPKGVVNTGDVDSDLIAPNDVWI